MLENLENIIIGDRYRIIESLGQGGSATTYKAEDLETGAEVALKALSLNKLNDWKQVELFESEAKILQQLNHPAIPKYLDYFQVKDENAESTFYIVEQLAPGKSLTTLIEEGWKPKEKTVRYIATKILEVLVYLQQLIPPVIHRDIKPDNIIYDDSENQEEGELFLVDFGTVQETYRNTITASIAVGTPDYMAPEQMAGRATLSTDLYGLGMTILFLLTGKSPVLLPQIRLKTDFRSQVKISLNFANWLDKMIEPKSDNRFPNAQSALDVLQWRKALKDFTALRQKCTKYTSIYVNRTDQRLLITIPPAFLHNRYNKFLIYLIVIWYLILLIAILGLSLSTDVSFGFTYIILMLLDTLQLDFFTFKTEIMSRILLSVLLLLIFMYFPFLIVAKLTFIPCLIIIFTDLFLGRKFRLFLLNEIIFSTQIKIDQENFFVIRNIFNIYDLNLSTKVNQLSKVRLKKSKKNNIFPSALSIKFPCKINKLNKLLIDPNYKFGRILTKLEKLWLKEEINNFIEQNQQLEINTKQSGVAKN